MLQRLIAGVALCAAAGLSQAAQWSSTNLQVLYGNNFELGEDERTIFTFEHANGWQYGDNFFFFDVANPTRDHTEIYGEWHPRLSYTKIMGQKWTGVIKDVSLASEFNYDGNLNYPFNPPDGGGFRALLYGAGVDLNLPGFAYFNVNVYHRDENYKRGSTYQISPSWLLPFSIGSTHWQFTGFLDYAGSEGPGETNWLFVPQLLIDVGQFWGEADHLHAGIEYSHWDNKYGVKGVDEKVAQAMVRWTF